MIISGYGRKIPQFGGMNCTELTTCSQNMAHCTDYFTTVVRRTFLSFSLLWHGCKKKVRWCLHSLCLLESCMRNTGHTRIKKMPEYYGQNVNLKPFCCCRGRLSCFPQVEGKGREGRGLCSTHLVQAGQESLPGERSGAVAEGWDAGESGSRDHIKAHAVPLSNRQEPLRARASFPG